MTTPVIMDIVAVVVLVTGIWCGARRGLLRSLAGLLVVVVALVGADLIASTLSDPVSRAVMPLVEERIEQKVEQTVEEEAGEAKESVELPELLVLMGLDEEVRSALSERVAGTVRETGVTLLKAVAGGLVQSFTYGILFLVSFVALMILLKVVIGAMNLLTKLPGVHGLNALGGAALGLVESALLLFLAVWVMRRLGVSFETEPLSQTHVLRIFTTHTPLSLLSFLH